jgi:hypothetical protein
MTEEQVREVLMKAMSDGKIDQDYVNRVVDSIVTKEERTATDLLHTIMCGHKGCQYMPETEKDNEWGRDEHVRWVRAMRTVRDVLNVDDSELIDMLASTMDNISLFDKGVLLLIGIYCFRLRYSEVIRACAHMPVISDYNKGVERV